MLNVNDRTYRIRNIFHTIYPSKIYKTTHICSSLLFGKHNTPYNTRKVLLVCQDDHPRRRRRLHLHHHIHQIFSKMGIRLIHIATITLTDMVLLIRHRRRRPLRHHKQLVLLRFGMRRLQFQQRISTKTTISITIQTR